MVYSLIVWNILIVTVSALGFSGLRFFELKTSTLLHQRIILGLWFGLAFQCFVFLSLGLVLPLQYALGMLLIGVIAVSLFSGVRNREDFLKRSRFNGPVFKALRAVVIPLILAELIWSITLLEPITWFDTGLYHLGAMQWLSHYGFVPGLALVNEKFGFVSSWFAFSAAITPGVLGDRIGATSNGFLLVLSSATLLLLYQHWKQERKLPFEDIFLFIFLTTLTLFYLATWMAGEPILLSLSHDLPVNYLSGIFAWAVLIFSKPRVQDLSEQNPGFDSSILPLILAFIILSLKLTGLFLIPIAFLFYISRNIYSIKRWLIGTAVSVALVIPLAIAQIMTSGCFLYPAQTFCFDLPWRVPSNLATSEAEHIIGEGFFSFLQDGLVAAIANTGQAWFEASINNSKVLGGTLLLITVTSWVMWRVIRKGRKPKGENWVLATAVLGSLFVFLLNKYVVFRFGGGILLILPTYFIALTVRKHVLKYKEADFSGFDVAGSRSNKSPEPLAAVSDTSSKQPWNRQWPTGLYGQENKGLTLACLALLATLITVHRTSIAAHWLLPPALPQAELLSAKTNDVYYTFPKDWMVMCWNAELPCAPTPRHNIQFRLPQAALGGGFVYTEISEHEVFEK